MPTSILFAEGPAVAVPLACALLPALFMLPGILTGLSFCGRRDYVPTGGLAVAACWTSLAAASAAAVLALFAANAKVDVAFFRALVNVAAIIGWSSAVVGLTMGWLGCVESLRRRRHESLHELSGGTASLLSAVASGCVLAAGVWGAVAFGGGYLDGEHSSTVAQSTGTAAQTGSPQRTVALRPELPDPSVSPTQWMKRASVDPPNHNWLGHVTDLNPAAPNAGPPVLEFKTLNFRFRRPGDGWSRIDAPSLNTSAQLAYMHPDRGLQFLIIAEKIGVESPFAIDDLLQVTRATQKEHLSSVQFEEPIPHQVAGIPGMLLATRFRSGFQRQSSLLWAAVYRGFAYQLFVYGTHDSPDSFRADALRMLENLELIDPSAVAHTAAFQTAAGRRKLPAFGCTINLDGTPWRIWNESASQIQASEYGARIDPDTVFYVVPVRLAAELPDREAAASALFTTAGFAHPQSLQGVHQTVQHGSHTADEWTWVGPGTTGAAQHAARVVLTKRCAYLLAAYCPVDLRDGLMLLRQALAATTIDDVPSATTDRAGEKRRRAVTGTFYNELGLYCIRCNRWDDAESYLKIAVEHDPSPTLVGNLAEVYLRLQRTNDALAVFDSSPQLLASQTALQAQRADLLVQSGRIDDACNAYAAVFAAGHRDDAVLRRYARLLGDAGRHDAARKVVTDYRRAGDSTTLVVTAAETLRRSGDDAAAAELLERRLADLPNDEDAAFELVITYRKLERFRDALKIVDERLIVGADPVGAYYWKGLLEYDLQHYREAKAALEKAHRLGPDNAAVKSMLEYVTAALGEGENLRIKTPIEPVPLPTSVAAARPTGPKPDEFLTAAACYVDRTSVYRFRPGEELTRTEYFVLDVQNEQGVVEFNTLTMKFDPLAEEVYVNRLEVFDDNGRRAAAGQTSDYYVLDDSTQGMAVHDKILEMPVPGLRPGCHVELVVTIRRVVPPLHFPFQSHVFGMSYPCRRQAVAFVGDGELPAASGNLAADARRADDCTWWQVVDHPAYRTEPFEPPIADAEPSLYLADRRTQWADEAREYLAEIADRLTISDEVRRTAAELTVGLTNREAKITVLADFVRRTIAYKAVEFGRRSRIMHPADRTLADRYGDCKDMSLLLTQLFSAAGVEARPALIHAENPLHESLRSLDQFNHMIVYLPDADDPRAIDPTDRFADPRLPIPLSFADRKLFVLDGDRSRIETLPRLDPEAYRADVRRRIRYDAEGTALVDETVSFSGYYAGGMRSFFSLFAADERRERWQSYLESGGVNVAVRKFALEDFERRDRPLVVTTQYEVERALLPAAAGRLGTVPAPLESMLFRPDAVERRRRPVELRYPLRLHIETIVEPPSTCGLPDAAALAGDVGCDLFGCKTAAKTADAALTLVTDIRRNAARRPAEYYEEFCRSARSIRRMAAPVVYFPMK